MNEVNVNNDPRSEDGIVKGYYTALDVSNITPEPTVTLREYYNDPEQMRRASWIHNLSKKDLKNLLHQAAPEGQRRVDADAHAEQWKRFIGDKLSNIKRADHPVNGGSTIEYLRTYAGPKDGRPGRLTCFASLQDLWRPFRNLLLEPVASDCDMSACAPRIARWLAITEGYKHNCLDAYLRDRKEWHRQCHLATGMSDKAIKGRINVMWQCRPGDPKIPKVKTYPDMQQLHDEVQELKKLLYHNPKFKWAHRYCDADNLFGTFFGTVLFAIEAKITNAVVQFAIREYSWPIMAIVHDGFNPMGKYSNETHPRELRQFEQIAEDLCPGIGMKWVWKAFDFGVYDKKTGEKVRDVSVPPEYEIKDSDDGKEEVMDRDSVFEGDGEFKPDYHTVKSKFERTRFKVDGRYVDYFTHGKDAFPKLLILSKSKLMEKWEHYAYSVCFPERDASGNVKRDERGKIEYTRKNLNFLNRWLVDPEIRNFRRFVNTPKKDQEPEECYNMWREYRVTAITDWDRVNGRRIVIKYIDFLHKMFGRVKKQTVFALDWQAHPFQHPGEKPQVMACLLGPQGAGKTTYFEVTTHMMGPDQCYNTINPDQNVYGKNGTACIANVKFINIQEVDASKVGPYISGLRPIVTDATLEVKSMGQDPFNIDSLHVVGLSSNFLGAMNVDSEQERRFWTVYCTAYWSNAFDTAEELDAFFTEFKMQLASNDFIAEYHLFCKRRPNVPKRFNKRHIPLGELQRLSKESNEDWAIAFLRDLFETESVKLASGESERIALLDGEIFVTNKLLQRQLDKFTEKRGWEFKKSIDSLGYRLGQIQCELPDGIRKGRADDGGRSWYLNLDVLRRKYKIEWRAIRRLILNRREHTAVMSAYDKEKDRLRTHAIQREWIDVNLKALRAEADALQAEYDRLIAPVEASLDEVEEFDAEAEYERVMAEVVVSKPSVDSRVVNGRVDSRVLEKREVEDGEVEARQVSKRQAVTVVRDQEDWMADVCQPREEEDDEPSEAEKRYNAARERVRESKEVVERVDHLIVGK